MENHRGSFFLKLRVTKKIHLKNQKLFTSKLLAWSQQFDEVVWLDSNSYTQKYTSFESVLAVGAHTKLQWSNPQAFSELKAYKNEIKDYIFGYLSYDLKNDLEALTSDNFDGLGFPELFFFQPKKLFFLKDGELEIRYLTAYENEIESDIEDIFSRDVMLKPVQHEVKIHKRISKKEYLKHLSNILHHIHRGDIYEVNFCQEFYDDNAIIDPLRVYEHLNKISTPPFAAFLKQRTKYLLSASPERFARREKNKVISQPIKGTAKRSHRKNLDQHLAEELATDQKERSENIMIVDLVRNDLAKAAKKGSVQVEELCKVYSFKQVHQLISTVSAEVSDATDSIDIIKHLFPMGSMTGAPKISAMQIIEQEESTKRGVYSGAVGYFTPSDEFDFNVVIRSILYNSDSKYLSYSVGGAITAKSDPEKEYQECLLKAIAMKKALKN